MERGAAASAGAGAKGEGEREGGHQKFVIAEWVCWSGLVLVLVLVLVPMFGESSSGVGVCSRESRVGLRSGRMASRQ